MATRKSRTEDGAPAAPVKKKKPAIASTAKKKAVAKAPARRTALKATAEAAPVQRKGRFARREIAPEEPVDEAALEESLGGKAAGKNLVVVESPTKSKTLTKFLGKDFMVLASNGHVMDLPKSKLGVDLDNEFEPEYEPSAARTPRSPRSASPRAVPPPSTWRRIPTARARPSPGTWRCS